MQSYLISNDKIQLIIDNFFEWSFGKPSNFIPDKALFNSFTHPAELHFLADIYNWDDDTIVLEWVLKSPLCSRATANLLFWRSLPSYFENANFENSSTCPSYCESGFALIKIVLAKYKDNDFSEIDIDFDPVQEQEEVINNNEYWSVPKGVYNKIKGINVITTP